MIRPREKRIKLDEIDVLEQLNTTFNETQATTSPSSSDNKHKSKNRKEIVVNVDANYKINLQPNRIVQNWCNIYFGELPQGDSYNLGKICLKLILEEQTNSSEKLNSDFNNSDIIDHFPGLDTIRIKVEGSGRDGKNIIEFRTRRLISKEDAIPILTASKSNKRPPPKDSTFIEMKHFAYSFHKLDVPSALFGKPGKLETRQIFKIEFEKYDAHYKEIFLQVKIYSSAIQGDQSYNQATAPDMTNAIPVLDYYFISKRKDPTMNTSLAQYRSTDDAQRFFSLMRDYHSYEIRPNPEDSVQDPRMMPKLLDYQKEAVVWMLCREGVLEFCDDDNDSADQLQKLLSLNMNKRVILRAFGNKCARDAYYSRVSGCISWEKQKIDKLASTGGILADEMGLGKTIEILSLILLHPRKNDLNIESDRTSADDVDVKFLSFECTCGAWDRENRNIITCCICGNSQHSDCLGFNTSEMQAPSNYLCPRCIEKLPPKPSKSTLIVVPNSLLKQWEEEIENNISDDCLKILIYSGIRGGKYVHPFVLSTYDIILTTYDVLRKEIHFTDLSDQNRLRDPKRFAALPCPLILVEWWRVCLDEAQMVEKVNSSFAIMARMIPAVNRWCVTGTPIPNGLNDLYGVVCFLGIEPITDIDWWDTLIMEPFKLANSQITITSNLFGKIFWRTEKEDVQDQMRLPRQTEVIHRLEFTPAEKYFYDQRSIYWADAFKAIIGNMERDQQISTLTNSQLLPFRTLRDICTHPQLDQEAFKVVDIFIEREAKLTMTVFEFIEWLVKRAAAACLKQYKMQVVSLNALAGLHLLKNELDVAARHYRRVIQLADENKDRWKTDDIQLLHALVNLRDVYKRIRGGQIDRTLGTIIDNLIGNLILTKTNQVKYAAMKISFKNFTGNFGEDAWWNRVLIEMRKSVNALQEFVNTLKRVIPLEFIKLKEPSVGIFAFVNNLQATLHENLSEIFTKREELFSDWKKINSMNVVPTYLSSKLLECCHLSQPAAPMNSVDLPSCVLCSFESKISKYELLLIRGPVEGHHITESVPMKSLTECSLDVIYKFATKNGLPATIVEDGKRNIGQFCDLKNEIKSFREWLIKTNEHAIALDALLQDTTPMKMNAIATTSSITVRKQTVSTALSTVSRHRMSSIVEPVQITPRIQLEISAFDHSNQNLNDCLRDLEYLEELKKYRSDSYTFDQSGSRHTVTNIPHMKITNEKIWRAPFTKVEGVVRTLLTIEKTHPGDKALVICTNDVMLQVFAAEFVQNGISYVLHNRFRSKASRQTLLRFRTDSTQCLLMPLSVASTGLNLTEANHVLLVEPTINSAHEEQAISRIHRLGQKKATFVHRFYVADTIEEKLVRMDKEKKMSTFVEGDTTIQDLLDLFDDNSACSPRK